MRTAQSSRGHTRRPQHCRHASGVSGSLEGSGHCGGVGGAQAADGGGGGGGVGGGETGLLPVALEELACKFRIELQKCIGIGNTEKCNDQISDGRFFSSNIFFKELRMLLQLEAAPLHSLASWGLFQPAFKVNSQWTCRHKINATLPKCRVLMGGFTFTRNTTIMYVISPVRRPVSSAAPPSEEVVCEEVVSEEATVLPSGASVRVGVLPRRDLDARLLPVPSLRFLVCILLTATEFAC